MPHQAHDTLLRKLQTAAHRAQAHLPAPLPGVFILTDPDRLPNPLAAAAHLFPGSGLIYRHFGARDRHDTALALRQLARMKGFTLLIGNDPELAQSIGADGVHWPEAALPKAADWTGHFSIMTAAAHSQSAISRAAKAGMTAALVSPIFPSASPSAGAPIGPDGFKNWLTQTPLPAYGLGGVTADNSGEISDFAGIAMIGAAAALANPSKT